MGASPAMKCQRAEIASVLLVATASTRVAVIGLKRSSWKFLRLSWRRACDRRRTRSLRPSARCGGSWRSPRRRPRPASSAGGRRSQGAGPSTSTSGPSAVVHASSSRRRRSRGGRRPRPMRSSTGGGMPKRPEIREETAEEARGVVASWTFPGRFQRRRIWPSCARCEVSG